MTGGRRGGSAKRMQRVWCAGSGVTGGSSAINYFGPTRWGWTEREDGPVCLGAGQGVPPGLGAQRGTKAGPLRAGGKACHRRRSSCQHHSPAHANRRRRWPTTRCTPAAQPVSGPERPPGVPSGPVWQKTQKKLCNNTKNYFDEINKQPNLKSIRIKKMMKSLDKIRICNKHELVGWTYTSPNPSEERGGTVGGHGTDCQGVNEV